MLQNIATVASFAFQISGAVILLLWYLANSDRKIKQMCLNSHDGPLWFNMDNTTVLSKDELQEKAKTFYQNVFAFVDILIGYASAIFAGDTTLCPCCVFTLVVISTIIILLIETFLSKRFAKSNYPGDQTVKLEDTSVEVGTMAITPVESPSDKTST